MGRSPSRISPRPCSTGAPRPPEPRPFCSDWSGWQGKMAAGRDRWADAAGPSSAPRSCPGAAAAKRGRDAVKDDELLLERKLPPASGPRPADPSLAPPRAVPGGVGTPPSQRADRPSLSLVVPCRNEARNLETLLPLLLARLSKLADRWEVVLVDDGSTD